MARRNRRSSAVRHSIRRCCGSSIRSRASASPSPHRCRRTWRRCCRRMRPQQRRSAAAHDAAVRQRAARPAIPRVPGRAGVIRQSGGTDMSFSKRKAARSGSRTPPSGTPPWGRVQRLPPGGGAPGRDGACCAPARAIISWTPPAATAIIPPIWRSRAPPCLAFDYSEAMVALARKRRGAPGEPHRVLRGDATDGASLLALRRGAPVHKGGVQHGRDGHHRHRAAVFCGTRAARRGRDLRVRHAASMLCHADGPLYDAARLL